MATVSNIFTDIPSPIGLRTVSRICVTFFNISWNASNRITCGDVSFMRCLNLNLKLDKAWNELLEWVIHFIPVLLD